MPVPIPPLDDRDFWRPLATQFRPKYKLHSEEIWYPMHMEDLLSNCMRFNKVVDGKLQVLFYAWLTADMLLYTQTGQEQVRRARWTPPDAATIADLQPKAIPGVPYTWLRRNSNYVFTYRPDGNYSPPFGYIWSSHFAPQNATWYHRGAPNWPGVWLPMAGWSRQQFAEVIVSRRFAPARKEPEIVCWAQRHTVAGQDYVDLIYTCYFGYNGSISVIPGQGEHFNDVVTNTVRFRAEDLSQPVRYCFAQHGGYAWYMPDQVQVDGTQPVVYLARQSHESYPKAGIFTRLFGLANDITDDDGVTWTPDCAYVYRPQGIDSQGIDCDALRRQVFPGDPNSVVLLPANVQDNLWQYVSYAFTQLGGDGIDPELISQGGPLFSSSKWWPGEGPAGAQPPLSQKAAEPSADGVPPSFFDDVAPYLGPNPLPTSAAWALASRSDAPVTLAGSGAGREFDPELPPDEALPTRDTSLHAAPADVAAFLDWTGPLGQQLIAGLQAFGVPFVLQKLPAQLTVPSPWSQPILIGTVRISDIVVHGLQGFAVSGLGADGSQTIRIAGRVPQLAGRGAIEFDPLIGPVLNAGSLDVSGDFSVTARVKLKVPLATSGSGQWYVPYLGPAPYSAGVCENPFERTRTVAFAWMDGDGLSVSVSNLSVRIGGLISVLLPFESLIVDALSSFFGQQIVNLLTPVARGAVNGVLSDIWAGRTRVA